MKTSTARNPLRTAAMALGCLLLTAVLPSQESWNAGKGATWQAGPVTGSMGATHASASSGASWNPGRESFGVTAQPGGVWHESLPLTPPNTNNPQKSLALGVARKRSTALTGLAPVTKLGVGLTPTGKAPASHSHSGSHFAPGPQFGLAGSNHGGTFKFSGKGAGASRALSRPNPQNGTAAGEVNVSGFDLTLGKSPDLQTLPNPEEILTLPK